MRFDGKVAIVTGAAAGIGRAAAQRLAREGAHLVLVDRDAERLANVCADLAAPGTGEPEAVVGDVGIEQTARDAVARAQERWGQLDVLVNNAGKNQHIADIEDVGREEWDTLMAGNLTGAFLMCRHALGAMQARRQGSIVNVSSISAFVGQEFNGTSTFAYNVGKAGLVQLTRSLATRYAAEGIRVNAVCPGAVRTESLTLETPQATDAFWREVGKSHPLGRVGQPDEVAALIAFVASDEAAFMTGSAVVLDGGYLAR